MKARVLIILGALLLVAGSLSAQIDNMLYVRNFNGATVGDKLTAAQLACGSDVRVPCVLVLDPSLAVFPDGVYPVKCSHCVWLDYRTLAGAAGGSPGPIQNPGPPPSTCSIDGQIYIDTTTGTVFICAGGTYIQLGGVYPGVTSDGLRGLNGEGGFQASTLTAYKGAIVHTATPDSVGLIVEGSALSYLVPTYKQGSGLVGFGVNTSVPFPSAVTAGDLLIVSLSGVTTDSPAAGPAVTDTQGNVYRLAAKIDNLMPSYIYTTIATVSGPDTVSNHWDSNWGTEAVYEYSKVSDIVDAWTSGAGVNNLGPQALGTVTTTQNDLIFSSDNNVMIGADSVLSQTAPGYTSRGDTATGGAWNGGYQSADFISSGVGTYSTTWVNSATSPQADKHWSGLVVAFRAIPTGVQTGDLVQFQDSIGRVLGGITAGGVAYPAATVGGGVWLHQFGQALCAVPNSTDGSCTGSLTFSAPFADSSYVLNTQTAAASGAFVSLTVKSKTAAGFGYALSCTFNCSAVGAVTADVSAFHN